MLEEDVDAPSPEGMSRVLGKMIYRACYTNSITLGETQWDVSTTQGTCRMKDQKKRASED